LSKARSKHSLLGLIALNIRSQFSEAAFGLISAVIMAAAAVIAVVAWPGMHTGVRIALIVLLTIAAAWVAYKLMRLRALALRGVEVEAGLVNVADVPNETNYRVATYRYEYAGRTYFVKCVAADFQMSSATRYGQYAVALVDPDHPHHAILLRSQ
jgi:hypothetical protein